MSKNLKIQLWFYVLKPRLYLKIDFLHRFFHWILWSCHNAYIDNLCPIFYYRTIEHLSDNIFKALHCIRLNIMGFIAVSVSAILLIYKIQQKLPMSNCHRTANLTFWGILNEKQVCLCQFRIKYCIRKNTRSSIPIKIFWCKYGRIIRLNVSVLNFNGNFSLVVRVEQLNYHKELGNNPFSTFCWDHLSCEDDLFC